MREPTGETSRLLQENERLRRRVEELEAEAKRFTIAEEKIQLSEARLIEAQQVAHLGSWEWDVAQDVITASQEFYRLFDIEPERIAHFPQFIERLHPDDRERVATEVDEALRQNRIYDTDYRVRLGDGGWRDIHARGQLFADASGKPVRLAGTCIDITERKQAAAAVQASEELARATLYSIGDAVISTNAEGRISRMNPVAEQLTGWTEAEADGRPLDEVFCIVNEDTRAVVESPVARVLREGQIVGLANHTVLIAKNGEERPIADSGAPIRNENGETTGVVLVFRDQTEERRAESEIRSTEERFRVFFDSAPIGKCMTAPDGRLLRVNPAFGAMLGYSIEEIQNISFATITHADDMAESLECIRALLAGERDTWEMDKRYLAKDGRHVWTQVTTRLQRDDEGRPLYFLTHVQDITERRRAQQEIAWLARFPAENPNPILRVLHDGKIIYANAGSKDLLAGWSCTVGDCLPSHLRDQLSKSVAESSSAPVEVGCNHRVYALLFVPIPGTDYVNLYGQDITERMRAEEAVRESEERNRTTLQSLGDAVISTDGSGRIAQMNPVAEALTGWLEAEVRGQPLESVFRIVNEETRVVAESPVARVLREGQVVGLANHSVLIAKNGQECPIADSGAPIRNGKGETTGVVLVFRNQTEKRAMQRARAEQEAQFRATFEQAAVGIAHVGLDGAWIRVNQRLCDIVGYTSEELLQKTFQDITHPDDLDTDLKYVQQILAGEIQTYAMEKRYIRKDRSQVWINLTVSPVRDETGAPKYFVSVVEDITARQRAQDALLDQHAILRAILQSTDASVFSLDREYRYTTFNAAHAATMKALYGVDIQLGSSLADYQSVPGDWQVARQHLDRALRGEAFVESALSGDKGLSRRYFEIFHSPIRSRAGETIGVSVYSRDVTERKRAEDEIRELNVTLEQRIRDRTAQLEESNHELEAFSYSVSHDLRAPLRAIDGFTRILADEYATHLDAEGKRLCSVVRENARSMAQLIDDLLAFSRLGRAEMNLSSIDMGAMANAVFHELTTPESRPRIDFHVAILPPAVADPTLMRQVWMNLLSNAIKFSSKQRRAVIKVSAQHDQAETVYTVQDDGSGFEMQYVDKLFGVFQRLHSAKDFEGTGVGLALVQRVIRRHGGRIWATGEPDKGATFCFALQQRGA